MTHCWRQLRWRCHYPEIPPRLLLSPCSPLSFLVLVLPLSLYFEKKSGFSFSIGCLGDLKGSLQHGTVVHFFSFTHLPPSFEASIIMIVLTKPYSPPPPLTTTARAQLLKVQSPPSAIFLPAAKPTGQGEGSRPLLVVVVGGLFPNFPCRVKKGFAHEGELVFFKMGASSQIFFS